MLGSNGSGKITAIKSIAGLLKYSGEIAVCGYPDRTGEAKRTFGYVSETPALCDLLTVEEHAELIARACRLDNGWETRTEGLLARPEILDKEDKPVKGASKGMLQKESIASAMLIQPEAVLFGEPVIRPDPKAISELLAVFSELKAGGASIFISNQGCRGTQAEASGFTGGIFFTMNGSNCWICARKN